VIDRRNFLTAAGAAAAGVLGAAMPAPAQAKRWNFVFILTDDLGWADVGFNGSDFYETPNLDRFSRQGMRFDQGYAACPVCSPTRASIMTGKYPARLHITNFIPGPWRRTYARLIPPEFQHELPLEEATIPKALKPGGYRSAHIGKWHLGTAHTPSRQGFDYEFNTSGRHLYPNWKVNAPHQPRPGEHRWERLTAEAEGFLEKHRAQPFFLHLSYHLPHIPLESRKELIDKYEAKLNQPRFRARKDLTTPAQNHPIYAAMIESLDTSVGRVLRRLDETGLAANTVVIFTSDNGGLSAREYEGRPTTSNAPLREGKGHIYEGGIRTPMLIRWPGVTKPGSVCDQVVSTIDFYPTLLDIAGLSGPAGHRPDGESITPLLRQTGKLRRDAVYWHYPHYSNQGGDPGGAVRQGDFKLLEFYEDNHLELYDIRRDPGEKNNLAAKMPQKAAAMHKLLRAWLKETNASMPAVNPKYDPKRSQEGLAWVKPLP